jgi:hypothetical protein
MGSTMFEGGSITKSLQINQVKLPQTKITFTYKELQSVTKFTTCTRDTKIYKLNTRYTNVSETNKSQACPNSTYTIGLPSLATITQSTQGSKEVMPPQVGYSKLP